MTMEAKDWIAIAALMVSGGALIVSLFSFRNSKRTSKSEIERGLVTLSNEINEAFARHRVQSPFAHRLKIAPKNLLTFSKKATLLFLHINRLKYVHQHKDILDQTTIDSVEDWAVNIVQPWVQADEDLKNIWKLECESRERLDRPFTEWLKRLIPTY
jgi:hypothetical protein